jgi:NTP pyrophosphatase (non-canonical NTP hydrolase)
MAGTTLGAFQAQVDDWIQTIGGGYWSPHVNVGRLVEEVGELARLVNHQFGPKPKKSTEPAQEIGEELADILFVVICMANSQGINLEHSLEEVIAKVWERDRDRYLRRESEPATAMPDTPQA